eukprot:3436812-Pleurochrysis_carterae.AAC.1
MKVERGCGRESQVDRNLRATTSEAGEMGNTLFALTAAQRVCCCVQANAAVRPPRSLMKPSWLGRSDSSYMGDRSVNR